MSSASAPSAAGVEQQKKKSYKEQLDEAAIKANNSEGSHTSQGGLMNTIVEKVSQYVPAVGKVLGQGHNDTPPQTEAHIPGPPERPLHDTQIEEFLRDQHRSRKADGQLAD